TSMKSGSGRWLAWAIAGQSVGSPYTEPAIAHNDSPGRTTCRPPPRAGGGGVGGGGGGGTGRAELGGSAPDPGAAGHRVPGGSWNGLTAGRAAPVRPTSTEPTSPCLAGVGSHIYLPR